MELKILFKHKYKQGDAGIYCRLRKPRDRKERMVKCMI